jgi:hypothetical protein
MVDLETNSCAVLDGSELNISMVGYYSQKWLSEKINTRTALLGATLD